MLAPHQQRVLALAAQGMNDKEIAHALNKKVGTVRAYLHGIYELLGVRASGNSRVRAALWHQQHGAAQ